MGEGASTRTLCLYKGNIIKLQPTEFSTQSSGFPTAANHWVLQPVLLPVLLPELPPVMLPALLSVLLHGLLDVLLHVLLPMLLPVLVSLLLPVL